MCSKWQPYGNHTMFSAGPLNYLYFFTFFFFLASCIFLGTWWNIWIYYWENCKYVRIHANTHILTILHTISRKTWPSWSLPWIPMLWTSVLLEEDQEIWKHWFHHSYKSTIFRGTALTYFLSFVSDLFLCKYRIKWKFGSHY